MRWVLPLGFAIIALVSACGGGDNGGPTASPTPTASATATATATATANPTASPSPTANPNLITRGPDIDFPGETAMIIESGCWGCDGGPGPLTRVYRDSSGNIRQDSLTDGLLAAHPGYYLIDHVMTQDASVIAVALCTTSGCHYPGLYDYDPNAEGVAFRSLDGGITWDEIARGGPIFNIGAVLANGQVLVGEAASDTAEMTYRLMPDNTPVEKPPTAGYPVSSATEILWATGEGHLLLSDGREFFVPPVPYTNVYYRQVFGAFSGLEKGSALVYYELPIPTPPASGTRERYILAALEVSGGSTQIAKQWEMDYYIAQFGWLSPAKDDGRLIVTLADYTANPGGFPIPAIVDLNAGTFSLMSGPPFVSDTPPYATFGRTYVRAVQIGPFARVTGTGSCLNIRADPSTSGEVLACMADGVLLRGTSDVSAGWMRVITPGGTQGWASMSFLER